MVTVNTDQINTLEEISCYSNISYDVDGIITTRFWDFGDNTSSMEPNPTHLYSCSGHYSITFTAIDNDGGSNSTRLIVFVENQLPVADMEIFPSKGTIFTNFEFIPKCSDRDGIISDYQWNFGDNSGSNAVSPNHTYNKKGTFWISLFVIDNECAVSNLARKQVIIENIPPSSELHISTTNVSTYENVYLHATAYDSDGLIAFYLWDFGDNTTGIGQNITHEYQDDGIYNVTLRIIDNDLAENTTTVQVTVHNRAPSIEAKLNSRIMTGERIILDASNSADRDGRIVSWRWTVEGKTLDGQIINYSFNHSGKQIVKLAVTDDDGAVSERTFEVSVTDAKTSKDANFWVIWAVLLVVGVILAGVVKRLSRPGPPKSP